MSEGGDEVLELCICQGRVVIADVKEPQEFQTDLAIITREACYEAILHVHGSQCLACRFPFFTTQTMITCLCG